MTRWQVTTQLDSDGTRYTYVWGPERTPLALQVAEPAEASVTYAYHTDALGSVVTITSPSGTVAMSRQVVYEARCSGLEYLTQPAMSAGTTS